jgi:hypothetical protein
MFVYLVTNHYVAGLPADQAFQLMITASVKLEVRVLSAESIPTPPWLRIDSCDMFDVAGQRRRNSTAATAEVQPRAVRQLTPAVPLQGSEYRFGLAIPSNLPPSWIACNGSDVIHQ